MIYCAIGRQQPDRRDVHICFVRKPVHFYVVKAAFIPALLSYFAIFSIVHLEAVKENIRGLTKDEIPPMIKTFLSGVHFLLPLTILTWLLLVVRWTPTTAAAWSILVAALVAAGNNLYKGRFLFPRLVDRNALSAYQPASFQFVCHHHHGSDFLVAETEAGTCCCLISMVEHYRNLKQVWRK